MSGNALQSVNVRDFFMPLYALPSLVSLRVSNSGLIGSLSYQTVTLGAFATVFPVLEELDLHNNSLTGPISLDLGVWKALARVDLSNNRLSSSIPETFVQFKTLDLSGKVR